MSNPPELTITDEARNDALIANASTGVGLY